MLIFLTIKEVEEMAALTLSLYVTVYEGRSHHRVKTERGFGMYNVVSHVLPVVLTTGMSASVHLPRTTC